MPTITNRILALPEAPEAGTGKINVDVRYTINFTQFERNLVGLGLTFRELVEVFGVDAEQRTSHRLFRVAFGQVPVTANTAQLNRHHTKIVSRASLDEDAGIFTLDDDEIICRIQILPIGLPSAFTNSFTNQVILSDDIINQPVIP
ncbi:MAG TPA: hypothetical protein VF599_09310 [Pyrinomonadaceae bacterium]|jgi:hypothetical protein